jgi:hypothetical protein
VEEALTERHGNLKSSAKAGVIPPGSLRACKHFAIRYARAGGVPRGWSTLQDISALSTRIAYTPVCSEWSWSWTRRGGEVDCRSGKCGRQRLGRLRTCVACNLDTKSAHPIDYDCDSLSALSTGISPLSSQLCSDRIASSRSVLPAWHRITATQASYYH